MEMARNLKQAAPSRFSKPRRRAPLEKPAFPKVEDLKKKVKAAMARPVSIEKVMELSMLALAFHRAGAVADSSNTFAYAVRAARLLPERRQEDALRHVRSEFRKTDMDMDCFEGLLYPYHASRQLHAR